jgi:hypothetical protein
MQPPDPTVHDLAPVPVRACSICSGQEVRGRGWRGPAGEARNAQAVPPTASVQPLRKDVVSAPCLRLGSQIIAVMRATVSCLKQHWPQRAVRLSDACGRVHTGADPGWPKSLVAAARDRL